MLAIADSDRILSCQTQAPEYIWHALSAVHPLGLIHLLFVSMSLLIGFACIDVLAYWVLQGTLVLPFAQMSPVIPGAQFSVVGPVANIL